MAEKKVVAKKVPTPAPAVRKLQLQSNGSTTVALPSHMLRDLKWKDKQKVVVKMRGDVLVISDWKSSLKKK
jgi:antitoxin component of MazEF toxin-antitoxin module